MFTARSVSMPSDYDRRTVEGGVYSSLLNGRSQTVDRVEEGMPASLEGPAGREEND